MPPSRHQRYTCQISIGSTRKPPGQQSDTPGKQSATHGQQSDTPGQQSDTPRKQSDTPGQQSDTPGQLSDTPGQQSVTRGQQSVTPGKQSVTSGQQSVTPGKQSDTPGQQSVTPGQQSDIPRQQSVTPGQQSDILGQQSDNPGQQSINPGQQHVVPPDVVLDSEKKLRQSTADISGCSTDAGWTSPKCTPQGDVDNSIAVTPERRQSYLDFFKKADTSDLGQLTVHEFRDAVVKLGFNGTSLKIAEMFADLHPNDDLIVTLDAYMTEMCKVDSRKWTQHDIEDIFHSLDVDGDGLITDQDIVTSLERQNKLKLDDTIQQMILNYDFDRDGALSLQDFTKGCRRDQRK